MAVQGVPIEKDEKDRIKAEIIAAMIEGYGRTFSGAVQEVNKASRSEVYTWRDEDADFDKAVIEARSRSDANLIDLAESEMVARIRDRTHKDQGNMIRFCLRTKGKPRGYGDSTEIIIPPRRKDLTPDQIANMTDEEAYAAMREIAAQPASE